MVLIMPTYDIQNQKTGEVKEIFCSYDNKEKELKKHGKDWKYLINACNMNYETSRGTAGNKAGSGWNDRLAKIHKGSDPKKSTIRLK